MGDNLEPPLGFPVCHSPRKRGIHTERCRECPFFDQTYTRYAVIPVPSWLAKLILRFNPLKQVLVVCRGYGEDDENFTELVWEDDRDLEFHDRITYPEFQLWIR